MTRMVGLRIRYRAEKLYFYQSLKNARCRHATGRQSYTGPRAKSRMLRRNDKSRGRSAIGGAGNTYKLLTSSPYAAPSGQAACAKNGPAAPLQLRCRPHLDCCGIPAMVARDERKSRCALQLSRHTRCRAAHAVTRRGSPFVFASHGPRHRLTMLSAIPALRPDWREA